MKAAVEALEGAAMRVVARSRLYRTPFVPAGAAPEVINAAALVETELGPEALLGELHRIEADFDRAREVRWGSRTLDLDLLMIGALVLPDECTYLKWQGMEFARQQMQAPARLILPHPRMAERAFVLVPAAEVAPAWPHPVLNRTIAELLAALPADDVAQVRVLA